MIADLKPYPEYKESGLPWLGRVPEHWTKRRMKYLFKERVEKGFPDEPLLAATQSKGVICKKDYGSRTVTAMKDLHLLKLVEKGDFVISLRSFEGGIEFAHCRGIISPAYTVLTPCGEASQGYYSHFFKSPDFIHSLTLFVTGIREGQNIDYERLSRAYMPLPPPAEQASIVRFLNCANGRLDRAIRAKRKIIALLNEQKQVITYQALTRGINSNVQLKPSGIEWFGDVPKHWESTRIGRFIEIFSGYPFSSAGFSQNENDIRLLRGVNVAPGKLRWDDVVYWPRSLESQVSDFSLRTGDIVVGMDRPLISTGTRVAKVSDIDVPCLLLQRVSCLRPREKLQRDFLFILLASNLFADYLRPLFSGISVPHISPDQIRSFLIALPPQDEQNEIVEYLSSATANMEDAIRLVEKEINLLREYRTRLVSDVVTGKLDVREAAATLPEEIVADPDSEVCDDELTDEEEDITALENEN